MPPDIRSFFGGKPAGAAPVKKTEKKEEVSKKRRSRNVVIDSDDDDDDKPIHVPQPSKKSAAKKAIKESPKGEVTTTDDYFGSNSKPKKSKSISVEVPSTSFASQTKAVSAPKSVAVGRKKKATSSKNDEKAFEDEEGGGGDDIFAASAKKNAGSKDDGYIESDSEVEEMPPPKAHRSKKAPVELDSDDDVLMVDAPQPLVSTANKKRKSMSVLEDSDDDAPPKKGAKKNASEQKPKDSRAKKEKDADPELLKLFDSIPLVRPPTPPPRDPDQKFDWRKGPAGGGNAGPPPEEDNKDWDIGAENCLNGLTFVFTGLLNTLSRDRATEIVKRYGGRVTGGPSSKTSFVILGNEAGPSKLEKIRKLGLKTIDENGLHALISKSAADGGNLQAAGRNLQKKKVEDEKVENAAKEEEREDRKRAEEADKEARRKAEARGLAPPSAKSAQVNDQLWTSKYAPTQLNQICGNKSQVEKLQNWLLNWSKYLKQNFGRPGPDGIGLYRAIIIHGPPGIGKTTAAHLAAKLAGYDVIETNASDTRSKKLVETGLRDVLNNTSLLGYFAADGTAVDLKKKNVVLILDEVDGMSAGDRGGVGALAKICRTTEIPMILICNERKLQKMAPFDKVTYDLAFRRPTVDMIRSRIATICLREKLSLPANVIDALIDGSNKDIRQIINMISQVKLDQDSMDLKQSKGMSKAWEKHVVLKPWDICHKLLGSGLFSSTNTETLNQKIELYFNDHEISYLMVQENYLSTKPSRASGHGYTGPEHKLKLLELADKAAESISDGDLVDRMIHGSQQQWSLMPTHAVFSTVRPASFMSGLLTERTNFPKWLGQNSKAGKLTRYVKEIQSHMRLRTSADRHEIRQTYLPVIWTKTIRRIIEEGTDAVDDVINVMDSYYLTREDLDFITELGLGYTEEYAKIKPQAKSTLTRLYNAASHPVPFMKTGDLGAAVKAAPKARPDLEEAIEEEDEEIVVADVAEDEEDDDVIIDPKKDKYIKQPKPKKAGAGAAKKKATAAAAAAPKKKSKKARKDDDDDDLINDDEEEEEVRPKKAAAAPKAKAKAKAAPKARGKK